jgi:hypothetical protein
MRNGRVRCFGAGLQIIIFILIIFSGCATKVAVKSTTNEELLKDRVMAYWNYKIKKEFEKSYEYEYPLFRKQVNVINYIKSFNTVKAGWSKAGIERIDMRGDNATVDMKIQVKIAVSSSRDLEHEGLVKEKWVKVEGIWYHIPQNLRERQSTQ